jgi:hypothetical protein
MLLFVMVFVLVAVKVVVMLCLAMLMRVLVETHRHQRERHRHPRYHSPALRPSPRPLGYHLQRRPFISPRYESRLMPTRAGGVPQAAESISRSA